MFFSDVMRIANEHLILKALSALEQVLANAKHEQSPAAPLSVRFVLAYLYAVSNGERAAFDSFWRYLRYVPDDETDALMRRQNLNSALNGIYLSVNRLRTVAMQLPR